MITNKQERKIWQDAYDETYRREYKYFYYQFVLCGDDEREARYIADDNARLHAKDIADMELKKYRSEMRRIRSMYDLEFGLCVDKWIKPYKFTE